MKTRGAKDVKRAMAPVSNGGSCRRSPRDISPPCKHPESYPVGTPDADGSRVWYCPKCGWMGKKPAGWRAVDFA